jgi:TonB family protein
MSRLQKKCVIATAGFHLLLLVILFVGPAFFNAKPKVDDSQVLDVIPANLIDAAFNSGVKNATPPAPTPIVTPQPIPTAAKQIVQPAPAPQPTFVQKVEKYFTPEPKPDLTPVEKPEKNPPHKIEVNTQLVTRNALENSPTTKPKPNSQTAKNLAAELRSKLSPATTVDMPGEGSVAYANYGTVVVSVYHNAWISPDDMANDSAVVKFSVTIASDGTVINARIIDPSGDANVDAAVRRMLNRVASIAPFPEGATEKERIYTINFNASRTSE